VNPAPFFRLVIDANIPAFKDSELYYPVKEFTSHADVWINTLSELIKGGWNEKSTDLKQVFLASICSCQLVHDQAKREMHEDVLRLIATLKKWIIVQDNEIQSAKAAKISIKTKTKAADSTPPTETDKSFEKRVRALFTAMQAPNTQGGAATQEKTLAGPTWQCQSCGNEWRDDPVKPPRCKKECVYSEHKDFNKSKEQKRFRSQVQRSSQKLAMFYHFLCASMNEAHKATTDSLLTRVKIKLRKDSLMLSLLWVTFISVILCGLSAKM
jgi:hypothetical protein